MGRGRHTDSQSWGGERLFEGERKFLEGCRRQWRRTRRESEMVQNKNAQVRLVVYDFNLPEILDRLKKPTWNRCTLDLGHRLNESVFLSAPFTAIFEHFGVFEEFLPILYPMPTKTKPPIVLSCVHNCRGGFQCVLLRSASASSVKN